MPGTWLKFEMNVTGTVQLLPEIMMIVKKKQTNRCSSFQRHEHDLFVVVHISFSFSGKTYTEVALN